MKLCLSGESLTLVDEVIKEKNQQYALYASGTVIAMAPVSPLGVEAILEGTSAISSCGDVRLSAWKSKGSACRSLTYAWSVSSSGTVPPDLTTSLEGLHATILHRRF